MGSRWASLGSALGQGISSGLEPILQMKMLENKVGRLKKLDLSGLDASKLALLGVQQTGTDPLTLLLYNMLGGQGFGGQSSVPGGLPNTTGNPVPTTPGRKSGVTSIIEQDLAGGNSQNKFGGGINGQKFVDQTGAVFTITQNGEVYDANGDFVGDRKDLGI